MRGNRKCVTCIWFEDKTELARKQYASWDGLCHWKMPATVAKDSQGWGDWHQKGSAAVKKEDWCSCHEPVREVHIDGRQQIEVRARLFLKDG